MLIWTLVSVTRRKVGRGRDESKGFIYIYIYIN